MRRTVYEVMQEMSGGKEIHHSAAETEEEAWEEIGRFTDRQTDRGYPPSRMWVVTKEVDVDFVVPPKTHPEEVYFVRTGTVDNGPGVWDSTHVRVMRWADAEQTEEVQVGEYTRNYRMLNTVHPFRQYRDGAWHDYALIAPDYTRTSVMDLATGEIIAHEPWPTADKDFVRSDGTVLWRKGDEQPAWGFCPVEFYVPDWWEHHDDNLVIGSYLWDEFRGDRPSGEFGFVAGCHWGDDSSWKIRYVDLSGIAEGRLTVDDRFGYIELPRGVDLKDAVDYSPESDRFSIAVTCVYDRDGKQRWGPGAPEED